MKLLVAFLFVVGVCVNASPFHRYGWEDGVEYVYRYESQVLTGIPDIRKEQAGGAKLVSDVRVQSMPDYTLRIKFEDPKLISFNEVVVPKTDSGRVLLKEVVRESKVLGIGEEEDELPSEFKHFLITPYMVSVKGGKMEKFEVSHNEPMEITNIKRAFLTLIYMDMHGYTRSGIEDQQVGESLGRTEQILKKELSGFKRSSDGFREYETYEEAIQGECKTIYSLTEIPKFKAIEMEELWKDEEIRYSGEEHLKVAEGEKFCEGKQYFKLTKTRDFNKCKVRPLYQKWIGMDGDCDMSKASCGAIYGHMVRATFYICGSSLQDFTIRKIVMRDEKVRYPLKYHTDEKLKSVSKSTLDLLTKKPFTSPLPLPSETREERSLVYMFPSQLTRHGHVEGIKESVIRETKDMFGFRPILPMPSLTKAPWSLVPRILPQEEIVQQAVEVIRKISYLIYESPESCSSKEDVVGLLMTVVKHLRHLCLEHLKKLESEVEDHKRVFYEVLVKVGSNPSVMLFKERLLEGRLNFLEESELVHLVQGTIRNVRTPTPELMRELVDMVKHETMKHLSEKSGGSVFIVSLLQLSNLFYSAYIHPTYMYTKYPVRIYGVFGTNRSEVITSEYVPFLEHVIKGGYSSKIEGDRLEEEKIRMVAIVALGKLGHMSSLKMLTEIVSEKDSRIKHMSIEMPYIRALSVYSMKRLAKRDPVQVKAILMPIIMNPAENDQVRIAAITVLAYAQPTTSQLQKLVMLTWEDKLSKQVASFIHSTMENLSHSPVPELIDTGRKASAVRHLLKPLNMGIQYSFNTHSENLIDYLNAIFSEKIHVVNTRNGLLPTRISLSKDLFGVFGAWKIKGPSFTTYIQGMDRIVDDFLSIIGRTEKASSEVKAELTKVAEELQMEKNKKYPPRAFILNRMFGFENAHIFDIDSIMKAVEKVGTSLALSKEYRKDFKLFRAYKVVETNTLGVTLMGLPYVFQSTSSVVLTTNGTVETKSENGFLEAKVKVLPIVNFKTQVDSGLLLPFTRKFVGASVEVAAHSSVSFELEGKLERGELKVAVKVPKDRWNEETETMHAFVLPYTVIDSYVAMKPSSLSPNKKPILTGLPKKVIEKQVFPRSVGLYCELKLESDNEYIDFASYYHKIREHSMVSIMTFPAILVSSLRQTSTKILFSPAKSETKEIEFVLKIGSSSFSHKVEEIKESIVRHEMHSLKEALSSLAEGSRTHMLHLDTILKGESGQKALKAGIVVGLKPHSSHRTKSVVAVEVKPGSLVESSETPYGFVWENEVEMPKVEYRWNVEKLLSQPLKMKLDTKIRFSGESQKEIKIKAEFSKTEKQIESVRHSAEYKKCEQEVREGKLLTPICMKVRHEAASLDKMFFELDLPHSFYEMRLWKMLEGIAISKYFPMIKEIIYGYDREVERPGKVVIEGFMDRVGHFADIKVKYGETEYEFERIPVPKFFNWFMPISVRNNLRYWFLQRITSNQAPASCKIEPKFIGTFDNVTYPYKINDCGHVLVMDRGSSIPIGVLTRTYPGSSSGAMEKSVKILAGEYDVELIPSSSGSHPLKVKVNGHEISIERGQTFTEKSSRNDRVVFEIERYLDDVYHVFVEEQLLEVLTNGKYIEVVVPQILRTRSAGLCGDLNGEKTTDLKSPRFCIMKTKVAGIAYMLNKEGQGSGSSVGPQCSGIPSELRREFEEEERECMREHVIPTQLSSVLRRLPYAIRPKVTAHAVKVTRFDICLSQETIAVHPEHRHHHGSIGEMGVQEVPPYKKPQVLSFVCLPKQSTLAVSLMKRAKAGENLDSVLKRMPISYKEHIHGHVRDVQVPGLNEFSLQTESSRALKKEYEVEEREDRYKPYRSYKKHLSEYPEEIDMESELGHRHHHHHHHNHQHHQVNHNNNYHHGHHHHSRASRIEDDEEDLHNSYSSHHGHHYDYSSSRGHPIME